MRQSFLQKLLCLGLVFICIEASAARADTAGAEPVSWRGGYLGAHFGGTLGYINYFNTPTTSSSNFTGPMGGGQGGYNWQHDNIVFGVEADMSALDLKASSPSLSYNEDWMATVRARLGYSFDRILPYITAGFGFTDTTIKVPGSSSDTAVMTGVAAGFGADYMLTSHWIARLEYLYTDVPRNNYTDTTTIAAASSNNTLRVGINYKF